MKIPIVAIFDLFYFSSSDATIVKANAVHRYLLAFAWIIMLIEIGTDFLRSALLPRITSLHITFANAWGYMEVKGMSSISIAHHHSTVLTLCHLADSALAVLNTQSPCFSLTLCSPMLECHLTFAHQILERFFLHTY